MISKEKNILLIVILAALLFMVFDCFTGEAGSLEPSEPPQPTMVTLSQLSAQIEALSSPVNKVVRGVVTFEEDGVEVTGTFSPAIDPNRSVVLLSDAVVSHLSALESAEWAARSNTCLISLTDHEITIRFEPHPVEQKVSYQIIEYK